MRSAAQSVAPGKGPPMRDDAIAPRPADDAAAPADRPGGELVRLYVVGLPVLLSHWVIFFAVLVLSVTGYYMHWSFLIAHDRDAWVVASMRFAYELAGFELLAALILCVYWFFA